ncbi:GumC domain-containing protein [Lunatibacter salilacus]|uniref:exopolysaccharide biosynthesis protein n=1 Tax=Lunatibacter salilacus TaxID=2483804 RepID=UPI00131D5068|nr:exopolysaccharide biosynthesis protein [Lunatibacter salilacus]
MADSKHILEDKFTFRELVISFQGWIRVFVWNYRILLVAAILGAALGVAASLIKKPVYSAETTFVLEESEMGGLGALSGLASVVGLNIGSLGSENGLFSGDNIIELYKSNRMLSTTLLAPVTTEEPSKLLIHSYISFNKLEDKWGKKVDFTILDFNQPRENFTVQQDSVIREIVKEIRKRNLAVDKPDRKLNIIKVAVTSKDEAFSKAFNETLVDNVNTFYRETKTKKTSENLAILQSQADSVRVVLDRSIQAFAQSQDQIPNPNPLLQLGTVQTRSRQVDIQASSAVYQEVVKNLEIAKINHRNNAPLIQIIDSPRLPLEESKIKLKVGILVGAFLFLMGAVFYIYLKTLYRRYVQEVA